MLSRLLAALLLIVGLTVPVAAYALGVPFGGRVTYVQYCLNGVAYEVIAGPKGGAFIWSPASLTYLNYQIRPGVNQIGIADTPFGCLVGFAGTVPIWLYGLRIQIVGTSLAI